MLELGGAQQNTLHTVANLDKNRFETVLISGRGGMLDKEAESIGGLKAVFLGALRREVNPLLDIAALCRLYFSIKREKPDIVHTHSSKAGILGRVTAFLAGVPAVVHTYHGYGFNDRQNIFIKSIFVIAERMVAPLTDRFIVVTREDIDKGLRHKIGPAEKYRLIRSGIKIDKYKNVKADRKAKRRAFGIGENAELVLTIGPFKPQKNLIDFVRLASRVRKLNDNAVFAVVGDGEQRKMIEDEISKVNAGEFVKLLGWRRDVDEILAVSDVFVLTSLWEGLPRSVLEAMCAGLPVVAYSIDGNREMVLEGRNGYLAEPGDVAALSEKLSGLLKNRDLMISLGKAAKDTVTEEFDIDLMVRKQEKLYSELTAGRHG